MLSNPAVLLTAICLTAALLTSSAPAEEPAAPEETPPAPIVVVEEPSYTGPQVPYQEEAVTDDYFADAAFIGNSLVDGFRMFSGVKNCDYYAATSKTVFSVDSYLDQMAGKSYGKIYILLGINEIGYNMDKLMSAYGDILDRLKEDHPDALIYAMGLSPVSARKDAAGGSFTMSNVNNFNSHLLELTREKECWYIDLCEALAGEDGFLPSDKTTDGVHFTASYYKVWLDYLRHHYLPTE